ncbi:MULTISPECIES: hypothetical protein [Enterobacter]|uniref:hypothetical protein n=1 Tax=Enterobacter TaxID=547 RepID=UPI0012E1CFB8|nr:hypothetical protein [Enterobacter sp. EGD-HP1]
MKHGTAKALFISIPLVGLAPDIAHAERVDLGWGNITPCSRVIWRNDGIFGTPSPTLETAEQRVHAYAEVDAPSIPGIQNDIQQCAVQGAAAATLTAIITSPAGAMPAFQAQFESCMQQRARQYFTISLGVSDGECMW